MKKLIISLAIFALSIFTVTTPTLAMGPATQFADEAVPTAILGDCAKEEAEHGSGRGVICVVRLVANTLAIGVGVVGAIGISVAGVQYLTAGGSEEQTRKAKRRILEIVIGFAAYALIYLLLYFLLPGFGSTGA